MNRVEFIAHLAKLQEGESEVNTTKGKEYCQGDVDALANFKQAGKFVHVRCPECGHVHPIGAMATVMVYLFKHFAAMASFAINGKALSEPIEGRVMDLRLYAALLYALSVEEANETKRVPTRGN